MQRLGSTWPVHVHRHSRSIKLQPFSQIVRHIGKKSWGVLKPESIAPDTPTFNVSNLLLDLDSETAKNVRQFDPDIDGEPEGWKEDRRRQDAAIQKTINQFRAAKDHEKLNFNTMVANRAYEWHINDLDIMDQVLRGPTQKHHLTPQEARAIAISPVKIMVHEKKKRKDKLSLLGNLLAWNGIPEHATNNPTRLTTYMLHKQKESRARSSADVSDRSLFDSLSAIVRQQTSFLELKRMVQFLLEAPNGSELVSELSGVLGEMCLELAFSKPDASLKADPALQVLLFSNDIVLNLLAQGLPVKNHLWVPGLHLAVGGSAFSAARTYLAVALRSGNKLNGMDDSLLGSLECILKSLTGAGASHSYTYIGSSLPQSQHRAAVFSFLTGCDANGHCSPFSIHSMMQRVDDSDYAAFGCYLEILGELGALRTLWHIYQLLPQTVHQHSTGRSLLNRPVEIPQAISNHFVQAFSRIAQNFRLGHILPKYLRHDNNADAKFKEDCRLDLETINRSFNTEVPLLEEVQSVEVISDPLLVQNVHKAFSKTKIGESLGMLRRLLREAAETRTRHVAQSTSS